jgi:hypothetical protein
MFRIFGATFCLVPIFRKSKFGGVSARAIVKVECAVSKKKMVAEHWSRVIKVSYQTILLESFRGATLLQRVSLC